MKIHTVIIVAATAVLLVAGSAGARPDASPAPRYRSGEAPVLTPPPQAVDNRSADAASALEAALRRAHEPRFVVLWNRNLSDAVTTDYEAVARTSVESQRSADGTYAAYDSEARFGIKGVKESERPMLATGDDWQARGAFESWLLGSGMKLVNRAALIRQAGIDVKTDTPNLQKLEMQAIRKGADYLIEINATPAVGTPGGVLLRVTVNQIKSGRTLVEFTSSGASPHPSRTRWVADDSGYHRQTDEAVTTIDEVGEQLAVELAQRLAAAL